MTLALAIAPVVWAGMAIDPALAERLAKAIAPTPVEPTPAAIAGGGVHSDADSPLLGPQGGSNELSTIPPCTPPSAIGKAVSVALSAINEDVLAGVSARAAEVSRAHALEATPWGAAGAGGVAEGLALGALELMAGGYYLRVYDSTRLIAYYCWL